MARRTQVDAVMHSRMQLQSSRFDFIPESVRLAVRRRSRQAIGLAVIGVGLLALVALGTWSASDPSFSNATNAQVENLLGRPGAILADLLMQLFGLASLALVLPLLYWGWRLVTHRPFSAEKLRFAAWMVGLLGACVFLGAMPRLDSWPTTTGMGGAIGDLFLRLANLFGTGATAAIGHLVLAPSGRFLELAGCFSPLPGGGARRWWKLRMNGTRTALMTRMRRTMRPSPSVR